MNDLTKTDGAADDGDQQANQHQREKKKQTKNRRQRQANAILSDDQCLAGLSQLPGLLALNMVKPGHANAMRGCFKDILSYRLQSGRNAGDATMSDEDALSLWRSNPDKFHLIEPLLSDAQIDLIFGEGDDDAPKT